MKKSFPLVPAILALLVLLCLLGGFRNYNALLNSDQYAYLIYGRSLARGGFEVEYPLLEIIRQRFGEDSQRSLHYGRRHYVDGEVISILELGFPLLLAAAIRLGGLPAAFGVNVVLLAVLIIAYFLVERAESPGSELAALAGVFILLSLDDHITIGYSLIAMRDMPAVALFWLSLCLVMNSLTRARRFLPGMLLGAGVLAFSSLVRLTNLVFLPLLVSYALIMVRRRGLSWNRISLGAVVAAVVFLLMFLPQMVEEASLFTGNPLAFAQRALTTFNGFFNQVPRDSIHVFSLANLRQNLPKNLEDLFAVMALPGLFLMLAGIFARRRRLSTWLIMLPAPLLALLLFSSFGHRAHRYRFALYPFIAYFTAAGAIWLLERWDDLQKRRSPPGRLISGLLIFLAAGVVFGWHLSGKGGLDYTGIFFIALALSALLSALAARRLFWKFTPGAVFAFGVGLILLPCLLGMATRGRSFNWQDAQHLRRAIEKHVPEGAVILGRRYLIQNVDYYTHAHGISPDNLVTGLGAGLAESVVIAEESGRPVFALDNRGIRSMDDDLIYLRRYFDLEPVCRWSSAELKINNPQYSDSDILTLFRVRQLSRREMLLKLNTPEVKDYLVLLDTGFSPFFPSSPAASSISVGGRGYPGDLQKGLNYLLVDGRDVTIPITELSVRSDRPLPERLFRYLSPVGNSFRVDFGADNDPEDELFVIQGLYLDRGRRRHYRIMGPEAAVLLPRLVPCAAEGWLELSVRNMLPRPYPLNVSIKAAGGGVYGRTIPSGGKWQSIIFPLAALSPRQGSFALTLIAEPSVSTPEEKEGLAGSAFLAIDWLEIGWQEDGSGSPPDD